MNDTQIQAVVILDLARQLVLERPVTWKDAPMWQLGNHWSKYTGPELSSSGCLVCAVGAVYAARTKIGFASCADNDVHLQETTAGTALYDAMGQTGFDKYNIDHIRDPQRINALFDKALELLGQPKQQAAQPLAVTT